MYYEINVSKNGKHFFATAERSATTWAAAKELYYRLQMAFSEEDGYRVTCTEWNKTGKNVTFLS